MKSPISRLRMFAGPNGSGKSTIKALLPDRWLGAYVNADEIEIELRDKGFYDLRRMDVHATQEDLRRFLSVSTLARRDELGLGIDSWTISGSSLHLGSRGIGSYQASIVADFVRHLLLESKTSFSFETVMSSQSKVEFLQKAQDAGYRTYLYFIATEDPEINIARVRHRVATGGHPVSEQKIVERYHRCLGLLDQAVRYVDRAYFFDSSENRSCTWIAEMTSGTELEIRGNSIPTWFRRTLMDGFETKS